MKRQSILHLADLHLGAPPPEPLRRVFPQVAQAFQETRDTMLERIAEWVCSPDSEIGLVLIAGDLFDHHAPPPSVVESAVGALSRIVAAGVHVITSAGNHDELSYPNVAFKARHWPGILASSPALVEVFRLKPGELWEKAVSVVSASYQAGKNKPGQLAEPPPAAKDAVSIFLLHGTVNDAAFLPPDIVESERCFRVNLARLSELGYRYAALGHIHKRMVKSVNGLVACYPGPPAGNSPIEAENSGVAVVRPAAIPAQSTSSSRLLVDFVEPPGLGGFRWKRIRETLSPGDRPQDVVDRLRRLQLRDREIVALELAGRVASQTFVDDCQALCVQAGLTAIVLEAKLHCLPPIDLDSLEAEQSLLGEWVRQWIKWQAENRPDPNFAELVLWEAISCFGLDRK